MKELKFEELTLKQKLGMTYTAYANGWTLTEEREDWIINMIKEKLMDKKQKWKIFVILSQKIIYDLKGFYRSCLENHPKLKGEQETETQTPSSMKPRDISNPKPHSMKTGK